MRHSSTPHQPHPHSHFGRNLLPGANRPRPSCWHPQVDTLSDRGFPVEHTAIVGSELRLVEDVTGRKRYGRAALEGAGSGAVTGLLVGLFLSIFTLWETVVSWFAVLATWTVLGAVVGALLGMLTHAMHRGRRDFSSDARMVPGRYYVTVTPERAEEARRTAELDTTGSTTAVRDQRTAAVHGYRKWYRY